MNSFLFSNSPAPGRLYLTPKNTVAISYKYTPDILFFSAHMQDGAHTIYCEKVPYTRGDEEDFYDSHCDSCTYNSGGQCSHVIDNGTYYRTYECPAGHSMPDQILLSFPLSEVVFQHGINLSSELRFQTHVHDGTRAWLQGTKVISKSIKNTNETFRMSNVHPEGNICWGDESARPVSLRGLVDLYISSEHNNDLVSLRCFKNNCETLRGMIERHGCTQVSQNKLIAEQADALYLIHIDENFHAYFTLIAAGFQPLEEMRSILIVPLTETILSHDGQEYSGYLTPPDSCGKQWFVSTNGNLLGQMGDP